MPPEATGRGKLSNSYELFILLLTLLSLLDMAAAALVWENAWAAPFASSIRKSGGQLVASGRIPMQAIIAAAEASAAAQTEGA